VLDAVDVARGSGSSDANRFEKRGQHLVALVDLFGALATRISEDKTAIGLTLDQSYLGEALNHRTGRGLAYAEIASKIGNPCVSFALDKFEDALEVIVLGNGDRFLTAHATGQCEMPRALSSGFLV
jgi:hypothetical protein